MKITKHLLIILLLCLPLQFCNQDEYSSSNLYLEAAKSEIENQNFSKAASLSSKGLKLAPQDLDLKTINGKANLELGNYDNARYMLKQVYIQKPKNLAVLQYLVDIEHKSKRYSDAICFINELLEQTPYSKNYWTKKVTIYKEMGNIKDAERALMRLNQIYPEDKS